MLVASAECDGIEVAVFHAAGHSHNNQDRWLVQPFSRGLVRIAAIDGVTPWRSPERLGDPAQWAAAVCLQHLTLPGAPSEVLRTANAEVHQPDLTPSRRQAMAAVGVVDLVRKGDCLTGVAAVSADCEVWTINDDGSLELLLGGEFRTPEALSTWESLRPRWEAMSIDDRLSLESDLLEDPLTQVCHAIGRYCHPRLVEAVLSVGGVLVASDGACIGDAVRHGVGIDDLGQWLRSVEQRSERDDLTCIVATPS